MASSRVVRWAAAAVAAVLAAPAVGRAALAVASGGSGTSANLSANPTIRQHQLICDPDNPASGSYSIRYDPSIVTYDLGSLTADPGYTISSAWIERNDGTATNPDPFLFDINSTAYADLPETGYIQVFFRQIDAVYSPLSPGSGFTTIDSAGTDGNDTHSVTFSYLSGVPDTTKATYTVFADAGGRLRSDESFSPADSLTDPMGNVVPYNQIAPATVSGSLVVPEPAALGVLALASLGLLARRRSRSGA